MNLLFNYPFGCGWSEYDKSLSAHLSTNSTCSSSSKRSQFEILRQLDQQRLI